MIQTNREKEIWSIEPCENITYLKSIFKFLMGEFCRIFGRDTMYNEKCTIFNDPTADCPMLIINCNPVKIRLVQSELSYWAQTIYQLSHELCHYAIRQHKDNKDFTLSWFEEIICESMSLYFLYYCASNWNKCELYNTNPLFSQSIMNYLNCLLEQNKTNFLKSCDTYKKLAKYNEIAQIDRAGHRNERNHLFQAIVRQPLECSAFCEYQKYVNPYDKITINFEKWQQDNPSQIIKALQDVQPMILAA